ncbi:HAMP domain-containing sensor histidine kinase [Herbaspirillum sp. WKF16]|uniref:sensor histidine kinase n=1 Tax=Herbaspirillum sp. WKF16 TaxID=3028312 RepID=UPI0023AA1125|nr:HAMP domain-containing sensor histidine kinase [Herbaspirillum sp. WKF16]WDZ95817.1 HAMP domain-containing sensor histidine kinase [Herbaspirillum sp. WKF16]
MISFFRFSARTVSVCYVIFSLLVLLCFATPLGYAWREYVEEDRSRILHADTLRLQRVFKEQGIDALRLAIGTQVGTNASGSEDIILLADAALARQAGNLPRWPQSINTVPGEGRYSLDIDGRTTRTLARHVILDNRYHLLVAQDIDRYRLLENLFIYGLGSAAAVIILLGAAGGLLVRRSLLSKVKDINIAASAIMQGDFSHRLPHSGGEDELAVVVETENKMLAQIEQLMDSVRNVSNAIAHDLRTPLAELRSRLEELLLTRPDSERTFADIECAIADVDRVIAIFNALLRLAEIDTGARRSGFRPIDIATIVDDVADFYLPLAESKQRFLRVERMQHLPLKGDPLLLTQAIGNLIDNALKYSSDGGLVSVTCRRSQDGMLLVEVSDNGPGIPSDELSKVQERFYRCDASRATPGMGLGLSVVAAIAKLHYGRLELSNGDPGLRALLFLKPSMIKDV